MKTRVASRAILPVVVGLFLAGATAVSQSITLEYRDFSDLSKFTLNGHAAEVGNPVMDDERPVLRLTTTLAQGGSAFLTDSIPLIDAEGFRGSFSTYFSFRMSNPCCWGDADGPGADGLVFVVQTAANSLGAAGGGMGYYDIPRSLGVEFDTFNNGAFDLNNGNHVGINTNGDLNSHVAAGVGHRLNDGDIWHAWVDYNGDTRLLEVRLSLDAERPEDAILSYDVDLPTVLELSYAFVGFTAGTGAGGNAQDILSWAFRNEFDPISGVDAERERLDHPRSFSLQGNYPNPFNPATAITFETATPSAVMLQVYDLTGRLVRTLVDRVVGAGAHREVWDGSDAVGRPVESGVYLAVLRVGDSVETKKMTLLK